MRLRDEFKPREIEVLRLMQDGLSNREISQKLFISVETVKWYNKQIYSKLDVSGRKAAARKAQALGLLDEAAQANISHIKAKHNLRQQSTPFVGRNNEIKHIQSLIMDGQTRLITVLAPGGMGKTRLAIEVARQQLGHHADGVYFVPLAPLSTANDIMTAIAENIGFVFHGEDTATQQLINFLKDRDMLLVLDNFEHLLDGTALVIDILQTALGIKILVTSRERLNVHGETVYNLGGLDFPTWETPEDALEYDAVKLFLQSAKCTRSDYALHANELDYLARICRLTAGMPLGIELAAGWVDVLSLEQIANEIQQGINIFETDMRDVPERHRSLQATFEGTWQRLTEPQQQVFMKLSVFRGGFTLSAAQFVAGANAKHFRKLAQKALIQKESNERYGIHELLRQFGASKLEESGELSRVQAQHAAYYADFMVTQEDNLKHGRQIEAVNLIEPDFENVRLAFLHIVDHHLWEKLHKFLYSLWFYGDLRISGQVAVDIYNYALEKLEAIPTSADIELLIGRVLFRLAWSYKDIGLTDKSFKVARDAVDILEINHSPEDVALCCRNIAECIINHGVLDAPDALEWIEKGITVAREFDLPSQEAEMLFWRVGFGDFTDDLSLADRLTIIHEAQTLATKAQDQWVMAISYIWEGSNNFLGENYELALDRYSRGLSIFIDFESEFHISEIKLHIGVTQLQLLQYEQAQISLRQVLYSLWNTGYSYRVYLPLWWLSKVFFHTKNYVLAIKIISVISRHHESRRFYGTLADEYDFRHTLLDELKAQMQPDEFNLAWQEGQKISLSTLINELLSEV